MRPGRSACAECGRSFEQPHPRSPRLTCSDGCWRALVSRKVRRTAAERQRGQVVALGLEVRPPLPLEELPEERINVQAAERWILAALRGEI